MTTVEHRAESRASKSEKGEKGGKFLTFFLSTEEYGIEILKVQEIIGVMTITPIPRTPAFIKGVINLRGRIIPIIDLRLKLSMEEAKHTEETCFIVVKAHDMHMGVVVDKVSEVLDIAGENVEDAPSMGEDINTDYILGIGKAGDKVKMLLDIDKVLSDKDLKALLKVQDSAEKTEEAA
jgi:purine-binding chemotaxis protein CheW